MSDLLKNLNPEQKEAVVHNQGPLLIVAGAGTGKTSVITTRIAHLVESGKCQADEILALTFTEKAAGEMEERVDKILPYGYVDLWISTFHAFAEKILKENAIEIGLPGDFKILSATGQWMLVRKNLDKFNLDYYKPLGNPTKYIHSLLSHFSRAKDENITVDEYREYVDGLKKIKDQQKLANELLDPKIIERLPAEELNDAIAQEIKKFEETANAYATYQQLLLDNNCLDFGDLISYTLKLFKERKNILAKYQAQFKYILVDEFQDTNFAQYELIKLLASPNNNITVVGDDDQCLPPTTIVKTDTGDKKISNIKIGDKVLSAVGKGYFSYCNVSKIFKNKRNTALICFKTESGKIVKVTDNHKMFCLTPAIDDKKYYYVYLMYRYGLGWRIGITMDLSARLRLERSADKIIGIKTCKSESEARFFETLYSLKYNIPTVCFQKRRGVTIADKWLEKLYREIDSEKNVEKMASDLNFDINSHHYCLEGVNRGQKIRLKINLEMCYRNHKSKYAEDYNLQNPKVSHLLSLETSNKNIIKKLKENNFDLTKSKGGYRLRIQSQDLKHLGKIASKIETVTGGILEVSAKLGKTNIQTRKALVMPAKNVLLGQYLPVVTSKGIIYDRIVSKITEKSKINTLYDLEVENTHNFVADGVVVHNSIYKFRGASISNILQFKDDFKKTKEIFLNTNYRSTQNILDLSYRFIQQNNPYRLEIKLAKDDGCKGGLCKKLNANLKADGELGHIHATSLEDEVALVVKKIIEIYNKNKNLNWSDFAILIRANNAANEFAYVLEQAKIPYSILASRGLYSKKIVLDILAFLKLLDDYHESIATHRFISLSLWGITHKDIVNFNYIASRKGWSLYETLHRANELQSISETGKKKVKEVLEIILEHSKMVADNKKTTEIVQSFLENSKYLKNITKEDSIESREELGYLNQFFKKIQDFEKESDDRSVKAFLQLMELELESGEQGGLQNNLEQQDPNTIKIMTIHSSKGLEFKYVFLPNMVDKRFPTIAKSESIKLPDKLVKEVAPEGDIHLQEERRLFYVAMTRAKEGLYVSSGENYGGARKKKVSRFLKELEYQGFGLSKDTQSFGEEKSDRPKKKMGDDIDLKPQLPKKFSFTKLKTFESCPYQYRFSAILKIPTRGKAQFSFGKTMHSSLQKIFELVNKRIYQKQPALLLENTKKEIDLEDVYEIYKESFIDDWYQSEKIKKEYWEKGKNILKDFYDQNKDNWPQTTYLEYPFNIHIKNGDENYTMYGVIDRIDTVDGGVRIVDYKTGNPKTKLSFADKEQLLIYQIAVQEVLKESVKELVFHYLDDNSEVSFLGTDKELEKVKINIIKNIEGIKSGEFPPNPGMMCSYCDFNSICDYRK